MPLYRACADAEHPDKMLLAEASISEAAHRRHEDTNHMRGLQAVGPILLSHVVIDNVISEQL